MFIRIAVILGIVVTVESLPRASGVANARHSHVAASAPVPPAPVPRTVFTIPIGNVASTVPVLDAHHVAYGVTIPLFHKPTCVSCGNPAFTAFHVQVYVRDYRVLPGGIQVSTPRLLFIAPRGMQVAMQSFRHNWLLYGTYDRASHWALVARNVTTGQRITLDSSWREGEPGLVANASTDGRTVVWQGAIRRAGKIFTGIWMYRFSTGQRWQLVSDRSGSFSRDPHVSGNRVVYIKQTLHSSQVLIMNLARGDTRPLTSPGTHAEIRISGTVILWSRPLQGSPQKFSVVVTNLVTGHRVVLAHSYSWFPQIAAGRYVIWATDATWTSVQAYDAFTGRRWFVAGPSRAFTKNANGEFVQVGGHVILFDLAVPCNPPGSQCVGSEHVAMVKVP